jgi:hypothetical protein
MKTKTYKFVKRPRKNQIVKVYDKEKTIFYGVVQRVVVKRMIDVEIDKKNKIKRQIVILKKIDKIPDFEKIDYFLPLTKIELL